MKEYPADLTNILRILRQQGLVRKVGTDAKRRGLWEYVPNAELESFERMFDSEALG